MAPAQLPHPTAETMPAWWRSLVNAYGDQDMIRVDGVSLSYREVDRRSADLARGLLSQGAGKGTRIGLLMPNGPDWVIAWLAAGRIGAITVGLSTFYTARELHYGLRHADVSLLLCAPRYLSHDYVARLEEALPELLDAPVAQAPLALTEAPYLRSIWFTDDIHRPWSAGTLEALERVGGSSPVWSSSMLDAVEAVVSPADLGLMIYTSGSTADPKGIVHTQGSTVRKIMFMSRGNSIIPANMERGDRVLVTSPFFWVGGMLAMAGSITWGAVVICQDDHAPAALLRAVGAEELTHVACSEAVLLLMQELQPEGQDVMARLKNHNSSQRPFFSRRTGIPRNRMPNAIGMTETFGPHSGYNEGQLLPEGAEGSLGPALAGVEYKIVDHSGQIVPFGEPGELCVRTPWTMDGMYKRERHTVFDSDGYYPTGDGCVLREDGFLFFRTRLSGMIKTSGANVAPDEVEMVLRNDPRVIEAAVVGVPDEKLGQMVVAVIVPALGEIMSEAEVRANLRKELSTFKVPKRVVFLSHDQIPRTLSNKVRKPLLIDLVVQLLSADRGEVA